MEEKLAVVHNHPEVYFTHKDIFVRCVEMAVEDMAQESDSSRDRRSDTSALSVERVEM